MSKKNHQTVPEIRESPSFLILHRSVERSNRATKKNERPNQEWPLNCSHFFRLKFLDGNLAILREITRFKAKMPRSSIYKDMEFMRTSPHQNRSIGATALAA